MKDEQMQSALETWFEDTDPPPPEPRQTAARVMTQVSQTRRRGRWLTFAPFRPRIQSRIATDTTGYQPMPIPATNGHTPTVIGRTQTMLSPAKAITAGALIFGIGGALLLAQPFNQQTSVPPAAEATAPAAPVEFTGRVALGSCTGTSQVESSDGRVRTLIADNDRFCRPPVVEPFSDPRLEGVYYVWQNNDVYAEGPTIWATSFSIVNDEGAWRGSPDAFLDESASGDQVLVGEGAYEGLTAIATVDFRDGGWDWHGWIIDGDLPPLPEEPEPIP